MSKPNQATRRLSFEDLAVGQRFGTGEVEVTAEEIRRFARDYDPQPFHLEAEAGRESVFGGLVASGWLTAALTMRLVVDGEFKLEGGLVGLGLDAVRWPRAVRPGDRLTALTEVTGKRESGSRPDYGIVKLCTTTFNQHGEPVQELEINQLVRRRR